MRPSAGSQTPWLESGRIDDQARAKRHSRAVAALDLDVHGTGTVGLHALGTTIQKNQARRARDLVHHGPPNDSPVEPAEMHVHINWSESESPMTTQNLVLRTVYISPDVDDKLRVQAFDKRTSKNDLIRRYLELGMKAAEQAGTTVSARSAAPKVPAQKAAARKVAAGTRGHAHRTKTGVGAKAMHGAAKAKFVAA